MYRRKFLRNLAVGCTSASFSFTVQPSVAAIFVSDYKLRNLPYFLDVLIPEDSTASASQLGIHERLISHARKIPNYPQLLELGCNWLNLQSEKSYQADFVRLTPQQRDHIVTVAAQSDNTALQSLFFTRLRQDAFAFYYANIASWDGLAITVPPQPLGYADFDRVFVHAIR